ncbi:unnamed protein product, partial [Leptidea sinapis]
YANINNYSQQFANREIAIINILSSSLLSVFFQSVVPSVKNYQSTQTD